MVYQLLKDRGLDRFYELEPSPGIRPSESSATRAYEHLDADPIRRQLLDFTNGRLARVTFSIPAIHCAACVWLLENLYRLNPAIGEARVHFPRKTLSLSFNETEITLSAVVRLLVSIGYEPAINLGSLTAPPPDPAARQLLLRLGVAGFAFGNIMLMSFPAYLGLNPADERGMHHFFGLLSILLAMPVLLYSASSYWTAAALCFRRRHLVIEFPIALGIIALFTQSVVEILAGISEGYLDSFSGLIFLLLCGQWFQRKTFASLSFERDYKAYFPLATLRREGSATRSVPITSLAVGDRILVRHQELIPADALLVSGDACIDYSFVTGEAEPVVCRPGEHVFAGGRQTGGAVELETVKPVSQSYLTSLWNNAAFAKPRTPQIQNLTNRAGRLFTYAVIAIAISTGAVWLVRSPPQSLRAFTSVLLVACPCALALTAPFTLGSAQRILGRNRLYLRNATVVEDMSRVSTLIFDKTGTLTHATRQNVTYTGDALTDTEQTWVAALARQSTHPASRRIADCLPPPSPNLAPTAFSEVPGQGIRGVVAGHALCLGSPAFVASDAALTEAGPYVSLDGTVRGRFAMQPTYRADLAGLLHRLAARYNLVVLSGDHPQAEPALRQWFGPRADLRFEQSPADKLAYVRQWQEAQPGGVMMIGDGLNDAGALRQSQVGIAVTEDISLFSPACDAILDAASFHQLADLLAFARSSVGIVKAGFVISLLYNTIGIGIASTGRLSPLVAAVLMPISSFSVIGFSLLATRWAAWRHGLS